MINLETSNEIIKHRALGFSYEDIANITEVSKPTVIKICTERKADTTEAKRLASFQTNSDISEAIKNRKIIYNTLLYKVSSEILGRDLSSMKVGELSSLTNSLERSLSVLNGDNTTKTTDRWSQLSDEELGIIVDATTTEYKRKRA